MKFVTRGTKKASPSTGSNIPDSLIQDDREVKEVVGKERKLFLKKIDKSKNAYLDQIETYSSEQGIATGMIFTSKKDMKVTSIENGEPQPSERIVRKTKGLTQKAFAYCSWKSAEELSLSQGTNIIFLSFCCTMITGDEGFILSKVIMNGRTVMLFEGQVEEYKETIDSFKKKWKHIK